MPFIKKVQDDTEFDKIKKEIAAAVIREQDAEAQDNQRETDSRRRYEDAKQEQNAALESGDMEQYRNAGLTAESARLEIEFYEKHKRIGRKPAANNDDDERICRAIQAEESRIKNEALDSIEAPLMEVINICKNASNRFKEINALYASWKNVVMKDDDFYTHTKAESSKSIVLTIENDVNGILNHQKYYRGV